MNRRVAGMWTRLRRWPREWRERRLLVSAIQRDLEDAGYAPATARQLAQDRVRRRTRAEPGRLRSFLIRTSERLLPSFIRSAIEPWIYPALLVAAIAAMVSMGPVHPRVRAGLGGFLPFPDSNRLIVLTIYPGLIGDLPVTVSMPDSARKAKSIESLAAFREVSSDNLVTLEAEKNLDDVLANVPREFAFPKASETLPWRQVPGWRVLALARLKPGVTEQQARQEVMRQPFIRWVRTEELASRSLHIPSVPMFLWMLPLILMAARLGDAIWSDRRLLLYQAYSLFGLMLVAACSLALWVTMLEIWQIVLPGLSEGQNLAFVFLTLSWLLVSGAGWVWWKRDVDRRCRTCLRLLRLPVEEGEWGALVVDPESIHSMCPWGHGHLVVERLSTRWTFSRDFWEELAELDRR